WWANTPFQSALFQPVKSRSSMPLRLALTWSAMSLFLLNSIKLDLRAAGKLRMDSASMTMSLPRRVRAVEWVVGASRIAARDGARAQNDADIAGVVGDARVPTVPPIATVTNRW